MYTDWKFCDSGITRVLVIYEFCAHALRARANLDSDEIFEFAIIFYTRNHKFSKIFARKAQVNVKNS